MAPALAWMGARLNAPCPMLVRPNCPCALPVGHESSCECAHGTVAARARLIKPPALPAHRRWL